MEKLNITIYFEFTNTRNSPMKTSQSSRNVFTR